MLERMKRDISHLVHRLTMACASQLMINCLKTFASRVFFLILGPRYILKRVKVGYCVMGLSCF